MKQILKKIRVEIKKIEWKLRYCIYKKKCMLKGKKEFLIFNTPIHENLGDHAIIYAEKKILKDLNLESFEIPTFEESYVFDYIKKNISKDATISITGGGFWGSQWSLEMDLVNKVIQNFSKHKIVIFPQTLFFKEDEQGHKELEKSLKICSEAKNLTIFTREEKSYEFANENYKNAKIILVPDVVLYLKYQSDFIRDGALLCLRKDVEGILKEEKKEELKEILKRNFNNVKCTDTVIEKSVNMKEREKQLLKKLEEFSKAKLVITDRLHGMIFATITKTPCIALSNYNYKVKGVYKWIKDKNIIYEENFENVIKDVERLLQIQKNEEVLYDFQKLKKVLEE